MIFPFIVKFGFTFITMYNEFKKEKSSNIKEWLEEKDVVEEKYVVLIDERDINRHMIIDESDIVVDEEEAFPCEDITVDEKYVIIERNIVINDENERKDISKGNKRRKKIGLVILTLLAGADIGVLEILESNLQVYGLKFNLKLPENLSHGKVIGLIIEDIPSIIFKVH
jgi:hypothetical protein